MPQCPDLRKRLICLAVGCTRYARDAHSERVIGHYYFSGHGPSPSAARVCTYRCEVLRGCTAAREARAQVVRGRYVGSYQASTDHLGDPSQGRMQTLAMATMAAGTRAASVHASVRSPARMGCLDPAHCPATTEAKVSHLGSHILWGLSAFHATCSGGRRHVLRVLIVRAVAHNQPQVTQGGPGPPPCCRRPSTTDLGRARSALTPWDANRRPQEARDVHVPCGTLAGDSCPARFERRGVRGPCWGSGAWFRRAAF